MISELVITNLMKHYPVTSLQSDSKDHARYALEQALIHRKISREGYDELMGYVLHVMYKEG